jgi:hypothetical protein
MYNLLRYQEKIHTISERLFKIKNRNLHLLPNFYFFFLFFYGKQQKHASMVKKIKLNVACVARSNLSIRRKDQNYQYRKTAARRAFSVLPK